MQQGSGTSCPKASPSSSDLGLGPRGGPRAVRGAGRPPHPHRGRTGPQHHQGRPLRARHRGPGAAVRPSGRPAAARLFRRSAGRRLPWCASVPGPVRRQHRRPVPGLAAALGRGPFRGQIPGGSLIITPPVGRPAIPPPDRPGGRPRRRAEAARVCGDPRVRRARSGDTSRSPADGGRRGGAPSGSRPGTSRRSLQRR